MESTEKFRMRKYSKQTETNIYARRKTPVTHSLRLRCDRFATEKNWQSQRGLGKVLLKSPKGLRKLSLEHAQKTDRD